MSTELVDPMARVRAYLEAEKSDNTRRAYKSDWVDFTAWCDHAGEISLPATPASVARYLAELADGGFKRSTIQRRVSAIAAGHKAAGFEPPTNFEGVKAVMRGIRRRIGKRQRRVAPATAPIIANLLYPDGLAGLRDRALVLIGFAGAFRRSELVAFDVEDISRRPRGIVLRLNRSKTDQEAEGSEIPIPNGKELKPVAALDAWLSAADISSGPIFRKIDRHGHILGRLCDRSVARIVQKVFRAAGIEASDFSGHSLRAGFVTTALDNKVDPLKIMKQSRHAKIDTLKIYDRRDNDIDDHAGGEFL